MKMLNLNKLTLKLRNRILRINPVFTGCSKCPHLIENVENRLGINIDPDFPVDIIYTYVNGDDYFHRIKQRIYVDDFKDKSPRESFIPGRFTDNNELRFSLRSLDVNVPWVNKIYIVTDNQKPQWLKLHDKITIIDHKDIIPEKYLPTFNSHVIECFLHKIPSLSEKFIYLNDDFFFTRPTKKSDFFSPNGLPYLFIDWRTERLNGYLRNDTPHANSFFNVIRFLISKKQLLSKPFILAHGPYAQTISNMLAAEEFFNDILSTFWNNRFRTNNEIAMYCHGASLLSYYMKTSIPCDVNYYYLNSGRFDRKSYYNSLSNIHASNNPLFICINDTSINKKNIKKVEDAIEFLSRLYPVPSRYENI